MAFLLAACSAESQSDAWRALARIKAEDYFDDSQQLKLAQAIARGNTDKVIELIKQGADVNTAGRDQMRLLFWAMAKQRLKEFEVLLQHGADPNVTTDKTAGSEYPLSVMELAAISESPEFLLVALKHRGNPNYVVPGSKRTIIFQAIMNERAHNVQLLVDSGADVNYRGTSGEYPAMTAALINAYDIVFLLLEKGADPSLKNRWGYDLAGVMKEYGSRGIAPGSEKHQWYLKVSAELKKRGLLE